MRTWAWTCDRCEVRRLEAPASMTTCCVCGAEWDALTASVDEVDAQLRAAGADPDEVGRRGAELVARLLGRALHDGGEP